MNKTSQLLEFSYSTMRLSMMYIRKVKSFLAEETIKKNKVKIWRNYMYSSKFFVDAVAGTETGAGDDVVVS